MCWWIRLTISVALAAIGIAMSVLISRSLNSVDRFAIITKSQQWSLHLFPECVFISVSNFNPAQLKLSDYGRPIVGRFVLRHDVNQRDPSRFFRELAFVQAADHQHGFLGIRFARMHDANRMFVDMAIPTWYIIAMGVGPLVWMMWRMTFRRRRPPGLCPHCGYDLRATPARCPECGRVPAK